MQIQYLGYGNVMNCSVLSSERCWKEIAISGQYSHRPFRPERSQYKRICTWKGRGWLHAPRAPAHIWTRHRMGRAIKSFCVHNNVFVEPVCPSVPHLTRRIYCVCPCVPVRIRMCVLAVCMSAFCCILHCDYIAYHSVGAETENIETKRNYKKFCFFGNLKKWRRPTSARNRIFCRKSRVSHNIDQNWNREHRRKRHKRDVQERHF